MRNIPAALSQQMAGSQRADFIVPDANIIRAYPRDHAIDEDIRDAALVEGPKNSRLFMVLRRGENDAVDFARDQNRDVALLDLGVLLGVGNHHLIAEGL